MLLTCKCCGDRKTPSEFRKRTEATHTGYRTSCKACERLGRRDRYLMERYGIDHSEYEELVSESGGCEICGSQGSPWLCVDHCHSTGKIRGILCNNCNTGVGLLGDTEEAVLRAVQYLKSRGVT